MYHKFNCIYCYIKLLFHYIQDFNIFRNNLYQLVFHQNTYILLNIIYDQFYFIIYKLYNYFKYQFILIILIHNYYLKIKYHFILNFVFIYLIID